METAAHNVSDLTTSDRSAAERLVGHPLSDDQRIVIQVQSRTASQPNSGLAGESDQLPPWCNVYEGLSEEQVAELEKSIFRRLDLTRQST